MKGYSPPPPLLNTHIHTVNLVFIAKRWCSDSQPWNPQCVFLNIFQDLQDSKKTYALVDNIKLPDIGHKGLKQGDIVISINEHKLENATYEGLQQVVHQLNLQKQIKVTVMIQQRKWRQIGMFPYIKK